MSFTVGNKIKKIRELRNYTQEHMANKLGMSVTGYGKVERDETDLSMSRLEQIALVLGMRPEEVISFDEKMIFNISTQNGSNGYVVNHAIDQEMKDFFLKHIALLEEKIKDLENQLNPTNK